MQLKPRETFTVVRQLNDPLDTSTYYVQAKVRNAETDELIATLNLTNSSGQRFRSNWEVPADTSGQGFYIDIETIVYTDSGYTSVSDRYGRENAVYLVQERQVPPFGGDGGGVDYGKIRTILQERRDPAKKKKGAKKIDLTPIEEMLTDILEGVEDLNSREDRDYTEKLEAILTKMSEASDTILNTINERPKFEATDLSKMEGALENMGAGIETMSEKVAEAFESVKGISDMLKTGMAGVKKTVNAMIQRFNKAPFLMMMPQEAQGGAIEEVEEDEDEPEETPPARKRLQFEPPKPLKTGAQRGFAAIGALVAIVLVMAGGVGVLTAFRANEGQPIGGDSRETDDPTLGDSVSTLPQFTSTTSPYSAITPRQHAKNLYMPYSSATTSRMAATTFCINLSSPDCITAWPSGGGGGSNWRFSGLTAITPTSTVGAIINASSTIGNGTQAGGLTISGGATTTGITTYPTEHFSISQPPIRFKFPDLSDNDSSKGGIIEWGGVMPAGTYYYGSTTQSYYDGAGAQFTIPTDKYNKWAWVTAHYDSPASTGETIHQHLNFETVKADWLTAITRLSISFGEDIARVEFPNSNVRVFNDKYLQIGTEDDGLRFSHDTGLGRFVASSTLPWQIASTTGIKIGGVGAPASLLHVERQSDAVAMKLDSQITSANGSALLLLESGAAGGTAMQSLVQGDSVNRFSLNTSGAMQWGSGSATRDLGISRYATGVLAVGNGTSGNTSGGIIASASSTIGAGTQATGLTISGGATTTGNAYFASSVGIGTAVPGFPIEIKQAGATTLMLDTGSGAGNDALLRLRNGGTSKWAIGNLGSDSSFRINTGTSIGTSDKITLTSGGNFGIASTTPWRTLSVVGTVAISGLTSATGGTNNDVCINGTTKDVVEETTGTCVVSSRVFKHSIEDWDASALVIVDTLKPRTFVMNGDATETQKVGFIAEEAYDVDPRLALKGSKGEVRSLDEHAFLAVLWKGMREIIGHDGEQDERLDALEKKIIELEKENAGLRATEGAQCRL